MVGNKNPKVLVIEPANQSPPNDTARPNGALGPAYLVGALRQNGIEADYLDATVGWDATALDHTFYRRGELDNGNVRYGMGAEQLAEVIADYDIVATSSIFSLQTRMHFEVAAIAKKVAAERGAPILVVSGGVNARALRGHFLANDFDIIGLAEGEQTLVDIAAEFAKPAPDFSGVDGIAFRQDGQTITKPVAREEGRKADIDHIPYPALDAMPLDIYSQLGIPHAGTYDIEGLYAPIQTSRGCQDQCTFCHISVEKEETELVGNLGFLRGFSNERIAEDVDRALALGVKRLYFEDDNIFYSKRRLMDMVPYLKRDGLEYCLPSGANLRFLYRKAAGGGFEIDADFIAALADFGLIELAMPFETRSPDMMGRYASGKYDPDSMDPRKLVRALRQAGIKVYGGFMIGFRDESWASILRTKQYAKELVDAGLHSAGFSIPVPFPGSMDFEHVMRDGAMRRAFDRDPLHFTDRMHIRGRPLFETLVPGDELAAAAREFWLEINPSSHTSVRVEHNAGLS